MKYIYQTTKPHIMKTIITVIAAGFILNTSNAQSVAVVNNDAMMAETTTTNTTSALIISEVSFKPIRHGYNIPLGNTKPV